MPTDEAKRNYAKAMMMAVNLGDMREASPCHPEQIYKECRFNASAQREYKIVLSKDDAVDFLKSFCATDISETGFKRTHTRATYEQKFSRISWKAGRRSMLCTYAEWLYMHDYLFEPRLPKQLVDLVPDGWKPPIGKGEQINE
ncbi:MAG: hypothetical protein KME45_26930 [Stenomitos rutilans HA7619-LM2]|nr:hypothetical protein [Stenomitos rutilans HA7619-LM2]